EACAMSTITARPAIHTPTSALIPIAAVFGLVGLVAGLVLGFAVAPRPATDSGSAAAASTAQLAADNALMDRWITVMDTGTREQFDAMVSPNIQFYSLAGATTPDADQLWYIVEHARTVDQHVHARTSDVTRFANVLVWSGTWQERNNPGSTTSFVEMAQLDLKGRFMNILETPYFPELLASPR
ncbi:MAG TPA: hypothetical protein VJ506_09040, partial [Candidatus Limnocylindrales bacterium]|nr:hypothetical protein [Candidatus Limnocylindrales bacterium]